MRYALLTAGTRGDVQPFVALAVALTQRGHDVLLVAPSKFEALAVGAVDAPERFAFASCGMHAVAQPAAWFQHSTFIDVLHATRDEMRRSFATLADGFWAACEPYRPHCVVVMSMSLQIGALIAERLDAACWSVHLAPAVPSRHTLPAPALLRDARTADELCGLRGWLNYATHLYKFGRLALVAKSIYADLLASFKTETLGLDAAETLSETLERFHLPILCAFSSILSPRPADWSSEVMSTGPWVLADGAGAGADEAVPLGCEALAAFLGADPRGDKPICVGFGSLSEAGAASLAHRIALRALALGRRCIVIGELSHFPHIGECLFYYRYI